MTEKYTITDLMKISHCEIERLLDKFKSNIDHDFKVMSETFEEFKRELNTHIVIEEKTIFKFFHPIKDKDYLQVIPDLIKEHDILLEMLNKVENDLAIKNDIDISDFKKLLIKHKEFEEKVFYPKLEEEMEGSQKEDLIAKLKGNLPGLK